MRGAFLIIDAVRLGPACLLHLQVRSDGAVVRDCLDVAFSDALRRAATEGLSSAFSGIERVRLVEATS